MIVVFETPFSAPIAINSDHVLTLTEEHERVGACCRVYLATDRGNGGLQVVGSLASVVAAFNGSVTPTVANPVPVAIPVDDVHKEVVTTPCGVHVCRPRRHWQARRANHCQRGRSPVLRPSRSNNRVRAVF